MKPYETYQRLEGTTLTERDKQEEGSPFWNEGKWDNFVKPLITEDPQGLTLVDMGCNAGLHLKCAEDMGFKAIGVDSNEGAVQRGIEWRDKNGFKYQFIKKRMEEAIDELPIVDYTVFINAHYYMTVNDFLDYLDKLQYKTRYMIIVTDQKNHINRCWASANEDTLRSYFRNWQEVGFIPEKPLVGENARRLKSLCFKSPWLDTAPIDSLDSSNHVQDEFYKQLDEGKEYHATKYWWIMERYRKKWSKERLEKWFEERIRVYEDIKKNGLKVPIIVDKDDKILDGNHRYAMLRTLGFKNIFIRKV